MPLSAPRKITIVPNRQGEGHIKVVQTSPHGVPWRGEPEKRPVDYFNTLTTVITFLYYGRCVKAVVSGLGRQEGIELTIDGAPLSILDDLQGKPYLDSTLAALKEVLYMDGVFYVAELMDTLIQIVEESNSLDAFFSKDPLSLEHSRLFITPYVLAQFIDGCLCTLDMTAVLSPYIDCIKSFPTAYNLIVPVLSQSFSDDLSLPPYWQHWYLWMLHFDGGRSVRLTVVDSGNAIKEFSLAAIINRFSDRLNALNSCLEGKGFHAIQPNQIRYCVAKQYGQHGCGMTASITMQRLLSNPHLFDGRDFKESDQMKRAGIVSGLHPFATQKAISGNLILEVLRRVDLVLTLDSKYRVLKAFCDQQDANLVKRKQEMLAELHRSPRFFKARATSDFNTLKEHAPVPKIPRKAAPGG